jgi:sugar O-acyltransferase (sialic acid O-acetyltransferase NeuD family)
MSKFENVIIGAGGMAREMAACQGAYDMKYFVEDEYYQPKNGVYRLSEFNPFFQKALIGIADCQVKKRIFDSLIDNTIFWNYADSTAQIFDETVITGAGVFIGALCVLTTNIVIGDNCLINLATTIGHDTEIGDHVSIMPQVAISGNVKIGNCVYIGTNVSIRQGVSICDNVTIGMGSVVLKDITESGTYVGNPLRKIK